MFKELSAVLKKPGLYEKSPVPFWDDEYISRQMLKAHLDPHSQGASRKLPFIDRSAAWIREIAPPSKYRNLLDLGCGPGIYAEKFAAMGYQVTGIDLSRRSIRHAVESAKKEGLDIRYLCQDYLRAEPDGEYDLVTMIYCDYGALSTADRRRVMETVYRHLKPGGRFLLDVFSLGEYGRFQEGQTWESCPDGGFWREGEYVALHGCYRYSDCVTLEQTSVITQGEAVSYYIWNTYFTREMLRQEAAQSGFQIRGVFGDVAGTDYSEESPTIAILLEK